jgi:hypothetical protein
LPYGTVFWHLAYFAILVCCTKKNLATLLKFAEDLVKVSFSTSKTVVYTRGWTLKITNLKFVNDTTIIAPTAWLK